jgi:hypothetical protein
MSITERLTPAAAPEIHRTHGAPTGWEPGVKFDSTTGAPLEVTTEQVTTDVQGDPDRWAALTAHLLPHVPTGYVLRLVEARYDPAAWVRDEAFTGTGKTPATTRPAWRYKFRIVPDVAAVNSPDIPLLAELVRAYQPTHLRMYHPVPNLVVARARVVGLGDLQIGKVDAEGGTPALLQRVEQALDRLESLPDVEDLVIADPGDLIENFSNTAQQAHTNDLALPDQMRVGRLILTEIVKRLSAHATRTRVLTVPSNHGQWRSAMGNKAQAGRPDADWGLDIHRAVAEAFSLAGRTDVTFIQPGPWVESLAVEVVPGFVLGLVHGHQWRQGKAGEWWAGQTHGDAPTAAAHVLLHGHWHNASLGQSGHLNGRPRWVIGIDPMDGGSSWWRNITGEQSEPSVTVFDVGSDGRWDGYQRVTTS